jgi:hypothetical protein
MGELPEWRKYWREGELEKSKAKAIAAKCWDCCCYRGTAGDITPADCGVAGCPLYSHRPRGSVRPLTVEQRDARRAAMADRPAPFGRAAAGDDADDPWGDTDGT